MFTKCETEFDAHNNRLCFRLFTGDSINLIQVYTTVLFTEMYFYVQCYNVPGNITML